MIPFGSLGYTDYGSMHVVVHCIINVF